MISAYWLVYYEGGSTWSPELNMSTVIYQILSTCSLEKHHQQPTRIVLVSSRVRWLVNPKHAISSPEDCLQKSRSMAGLRKLKTPKYWWMLGCCNVCRSGFWNGGGWWGWGHYWNELEEAGRKLERCAPEAHWGLQRQPRGGRGLRFGQHHVCYSSNNRERFVNYLSTHNHYYVLFVLFFLIQEYPFFFHISSLWGKDVSEFTFAVSGQEFGLPIHSHGTRTQPSMVCRLRRYSWAISTLCLGTIFVQGYPFCPYIAMVCIERRLRLHSVWTTKPFGWGFVALT